MFATGALLVLSLAAAQVAPADDIVTGTVLTGCGERVYHPPGPRERFEGVLYSWIDNGGFVPCATVADCRRFLELDSLDFTTTDEGLDQLRERQQPLGGIYGTFRIRFIGRRGAMTLPHCADHTLPDLPAYVRIERVLSLDRLDDLKD